MLSNFWSFAIFVPPHCNKLQHIATHCNTLQHDITRLNLLQLQHLCSVAALLRTRQLRTVLCLKLRGPKFGTYSDGGFWDFLLLINILHIIMSQTKANADNGTVHTVDAVMTQSLIMTTWMTTRTTLKVLLHVLTATATATRMTTTTISKIPHTVTATSGGWKRKNLRGNHCVL